MNEFKTNSTLFLAAELSECTENINISSLGKPATLSDVQGEQAKYDSIVHDLNDKKQDIKDKKIESKNKKSEVTVKQTKLKELEESYDKLKDTKDKLIVTGNDIQKRLSILTGLSKKTTEENGGKLHFVYLPEYSRYEKKFFKKENNI